MVSTETGSLGLFPDEPTLTPHLDDFTEESPLFKARLLLDELLDATCEVPLSDINDMAVNVGVNTTDLLAWATKSESCFVDWASGHIRCQEEDTTQPVPPPESPPSSPDIGGDDDDDDEDDDGEDS